MKDKILKMLAENARLSAADMARRLNAPESAVEAAIVELEQSNVIKGYKAIINDNKLPEAGVRALIEVKVTPQRDGGFDAIAKRISRFAEVTDLYLVAGHYDLRIEIQGENLQEVAAFVYEKLAPMEGVNSTATIFLLKKYKEAGRMMDEDVQYERLKVSP